MALADHGSGQFDTPYRLLMQAWAAITSGDSIIIMADEPRRCPATRPVPPLRMPPLGAPTSSSALFYPCRRGCRRFQEEQRGRELGDPRELSTVEKERADGDVGVPRNTHADGDVGVPRKNSEGGSLEIPGSFPPLKRKEPTKMSAFHSGRTQRLSVSMRFDRPMLMRA